VREELRPDIVGVSSHIASMLLTQLDKERKQNVQLEKKLDRERRRTQQSATLHCTTVYSASDILDTVYDFLLFLKRHFKKRKSHVFLKSEKKRKIAVNPVFYIACNAG